MATVSDILQQVAILMGLTNVSQLTVNGFNFGLAGLNQARQFAERQTDFKYAETNAYLSISATGTSLSEAYYSTPAINTVTVSSGGTPDVSGTFNFFGYANGYPIYINGAFVLFHIDLGYWVISQSFDFTDSFSMFGGSMDPAGTYVGQGAYTGSVSATSTNSILKIKRVKFVSLPIGGSQYQPVEFLSNDQFLSRVRMQIGRQAFNSVKNLSMLGSVGLVNPVAYQNANTLYLSGGGIAFPVVAQLNVMQWMPDYVNDTDSDFFTIYGTEYLIWQTVLEVNKKFKWLTVRQEGDVAEANAQASATAALQTLLAWDAGIEDGTTEPHIAPNPPISAAVSAQPS